MIKFPLFFKKTADDFAILLEYYYTNTNVNTTFIGKPL